MHVAVRGENLVHLRNELRTHADSVGLVAWFLLLQRVGSEEPNGPGDLKKQDVFVSWTAAAELTR